MAETLQDFLISVKYQVDSASQGNFLNALKRVAGSVSGVAAEIGALSGAIIGLSKTMAETGEKFYFMSQRLASSVDDIKAATYAMSNFGVSADAAAGSMERFGSWTRSMGPAATAYMRSLGVTARDAATQMVQLGKHLAEMSSRGPMGYAMAMRQASVMGIDENTMRAITAPGYAADVERAGVIQQLVWGVKTKSQADAAAQRWATQSNQIMRQFREMGLIFDTFRQKFGAELFAQVLPKLQALNELLIKNAPLINQFLHVTATGLGQFLTLITSVTEAFMNLPGAVQIAFAALAGFRPLVALMTSPLGRLIAMLTALFLIIEDFQTYKAGGITMIDWGSITEVFDKIGDAVKPLTDIIKAFNDWGDSVTGVSGSFAAMEVAIGAIALHWGTIKGLGTIKNLLWGAGKTAAGAGAATAAEGGLMGAAGIGSLIPPVVLVVIGTTIGTYMAQAFEKWLREKFPNIFKENFDPVEGGTAGHGGKLKVPIETPGWMKGEGFWDFWKKITAWPGDKKKDTPENLQQQGEIQGEAAGKKMAEVLMGPAANQFAGPGAPSFGVADPRVGTSGTFGNFLAGRAGGGGGGGGGGGVDTSGLTLGGPQTGNVSGGSNERAAMMRDYFVKQLGISSDQSSRLVSAMIHESGLDPTIGIGGTHGAAALLKDFGIAQWVGSRKRELFKFARENHLAVDALDTQMRFVVKELTGTHRYVLNEMLAGNPRAGHAYEAGGDYSMPWTFGYHMGNYNRVRNLPSVSLGQALATPPLGTKPATDAPSAGKGPVQTNTTTIHVAAGPTAHATASRVADAQDYVNQRQMRRYSDSVA